MNYEFLKRLFTACSDEEGKYADGTNLAELYERLEDVAVAIQHFNEVLDRAASGPAAGDAVMSAAYEIANASELQGFVNGFRLCARMRRELLGEEARA